MKAKKNSNK